MKIQQSAENYLETILMITERSGSCRSIDIANELGYSKPSVSVAMKNLRENGYIDVMVVFLYVGELLIEREKVLRCGVLRLVALGVDKDIAAEDACRIEHIISADTFEAIKRHFKGEK